MIDERTKRLTLIACILGSAILAGPVYALIQQPTLGWSDPEVWGTGLGGLGALAAFLAYERVAPHPMLPPSIFRSRNFAVGNVVTLAAYAGLGAATFFVAIFLQQVTGYSALDAGLALLPITLLLVTLSRTAGTPASHRASTTRSPASPGCWRSPRSAPCCRAQFSAQIDSRLGGRALPPPDREYVVQATRRPLTLPDRDVSARTRAEALAADVTAFRAAMIVSGLLMMAGGVIAFVGIHNPRRETARAPGEAQPAAA